MNVKCLDREGRNKQIYGIWELYGLEGIFLGFFIQKVYKLKEMIGKEIQ